MKATIRRRNPGDDDEWRRLRGSLWPHLTLEENRRETAGWAARTDAVVFVVELGEGRSLCGFIEVGARSVADGCETGPVAYLEGWHVDPGRRHLGLGGALLAAAEAWARTMGYREIASDAEIENALGQRAHAKYGFREVERAVHFVKAL